MEEIFLGGLLRYNNGSHFYDNVLLYSTLPTNSTYKIHSVSCLLLTYISICIRTACYRMLNNICVERIFCRYFLIEADVWYLYKTRYAAATFFAKKEGKAKAANVLSSLHTALMDIIHCDSTNKKNVPQILLRKLYLLFKNLYTMVAMY